MRSKLERALWVVGVAAFAIGSAACSISTEQILQMEEGSGLAIDIPPLPTIDLPLEGGVVMTIDISIGIFDLLFGNIGGDVEVGDLLFAAEPFTLLGLASEEICVVKDGEGTGTFNANIYSELATFSVTMNTLALVGNPVLAGLLPGGGFAFPFDLESELALTLADMLGLAIGGGGGLSVSQSVDIPIVVPIGPGLPGQVTGLLELSGTDAFPTSQRLDDCIAFLNE